MNSFNDVNKKVPTIFSALNTPLFNIDKRNAAVRDYYEEIDQVVPLGWKFVAAVICPSGKSCSAQYSPSAIFLREVSHRIR